MSFIDDIVAQLVAEGVGTVSSPTVQGNIFTGSKALIPTGDGPYLTVSETGGMAPTRIQNKAAAATLRPTAQILVRGTNEPAARAMIGAAYAALDGLFNVVLSGTPYLSITARQEPTDMGLDAGASGRIQFVFNVQAEKAQSA